MSFTLFTFIFIFAVAGIFFVTPGKFRKYILLLASILYVLKYNTSSCAWMVLTSVVVYLTDLLLHKLVRADRKAKVVLLDLYSTTINADDYQYTWLMQNLYGVRFSVNKLQMLYASAEPYKFEEYFPAFTHYHDRLGELNDEDYLYPLTAPKTLRNTDPRIPIIHR